jgi:hypothetical protein
MAHTTSMNRMLLIINCLVCDRIVNHMINIILFLQLNKYFRYPYYEAGRSLQGKAEKTWGKETPVGCRVKMLAIFASLLPLLPKFFR